MRSCLKSGPELRRARPLLGTIVEVAVPRGARARAAIEHAFSAIAKVQTLMSAHDPGSDLGRLHDAVIGTPTRVHSWTWRVLAAAKKVNGATAGAFDPIAAGRLALASRRLPRWPGRSPARGAVWNDVELLSRQRVRLRQAIRFDLGGVAKGFAVDRAVQALRAAGMPWGLVNAGGDLRAFGQRAWPVHVRHPSAPGELVPVGWLQHGAVATSAPYFTHEISAGRPSAHFDPFSGRTITGATSVTVFARTCVMADALTKAVLLEAENPALSRFRARALVLAVTEAPRHAA